MIAGVATEADLDRRILAAIDASRTSWALDEATLDALALDLFAHQWERLPAYRRFAARRGAVPGHVDGWQQIPPVPASVFKNLRWATSPPERTCRRFRSSGTTAAERATLELDTLALYDAALLPPLERFLFPDGARLDWLALLPDPEHATDSSLAYMVGEAARTLARSVRYCVADGRLDLDAVIEALRTAAADERPLALFGTAFAYVHLVDTLAARRQSLELSAGSRLMETGGFKGLSRTVARAELYAALSTHLGLPARAIVSEYGMTEMSSQFYDAALRDRIDDPEQRVLVGPPWVRTTVVDPRTLEPVANGQAGVLVHLDLAARGSAVRLETEDIGRREADGFVLLGRVTDAAPRGCSLAYEEIARHPADARNEPGDMPDTPGGAPDDPGGVPGDRAGGGSDADRD